MLFRAKANKALDRAEDPREMLDYSYQRQLELLQQVRRGLADVATSRTAQRADTRDATGTAGAFHQRPGDRRPLPPPAGHVGVALVDRGIELPGMLATKSRACATPVHATAPPRSPRACRTAGCWPRCR